MKKRLSERLGLLIKYVFVLLRYFRTDTVQNVQIILDDNPIFTHHKLLDIYDI